MSDLAAELQAATDANVARWNAEREAAEPPVPEEVAADRETVRRLLEEGGRVLASVRSRRSGRHVTVRLTAKKKGPDGRYVSRAKVEGRVGIGEAAAVFADDPDAEWPENKLGTLRLDTGEWRSARGAERNRAWVAEKLLLYALGRYPLEDQAEVYVATRCCQCGKRLSDPVSVERGIGPECFRKRTGSRAANRHVLAEVES